MKIITGWDTPQGFCLIKKEDGKRVKEYFPHGHWYFYILKEDYEKAKPRFREYYNLGIITKTVQGTQYVKVYGNRIVRGEWTVNELREDLTADDVKVFEFDVKAWKRYVIDNKIQIEEEYRVLYFDIETDDSNQGIEIGRDRILSWAAIDPDGNEYFEVGDEKKILRAFIRLIEKYDVIAGWNSDNFDLPYIADRCARHSIKYDWRTIMHIDMLQRARKIYGYEAVIIGLKSFSLNEVARVLLNDKKVEHTESILELFETNIPKLKEYNLQDVRLLKKLDEKSNMLYLMIKECVWTGTPLDSFSVGQLLDNYLLRESRNRASICESAPTWDEATERKKSGYVGAYVMTPTPGYYRDIHVFDFKSLYPSIILGWNIGANALDNEKSELGQHALVAWLNGQRIETADFLKWHEFLKEQKEKLDPKNECYQTANNAFFRRDVTSFVGELTENFLNERKEYKKKLKDLDPGTSEYNNTYAAERVVKELANSMYGIHGDTSCRYYNKLVAESITYTGQYLNRASSESIKQFDLVALYGDTDSVMITGQEPDADKINEVFRNELETFFQGLHKNIVQLEYEKVFAHFIILSKKKYTGILSMQDGRECWKHFAHGTEDAKKSYLTYCQKRFRELTSMIFEGATESEVAKWIVDERTKVLNKEPELIDLTLRTAATKSPAEYKTTSPVIRLVSRLIDEKRILAPKQGKQGAVFLEYLMTKNNGLLTCLLPEEATKENIDWQYYWEKQIYPPLLRVLEAVYPNRNWMWYSVDNKQAALW